MAVCCCRRSLRSSSEQSGVLDGDDCLAGEILDQLDLLVGEWAHLLAVDADRSDKLVFLKHGNAQECASAPENNKRMLMVRRIGGNVSDMDNLFGASHEVEAAPGARAEPRVRGGASRRKLAGTPCWATIGNAPS